MMKMMPGYDVVAGIYRNRTDLSNKIGRTYEKFVMDNYQRMDLPSDYKSSHGSSLEKYAAKIDVGSGSERISSYIVARYRGDDDDDDDDYDDYEDDDDYDDYDDDDDDTPDWSGGIHDDVL
jgi:hypothetical protein